MPDAEGFDLFGFDAAGGGDIFAAAGQAPRHDNFGDTSVRGIPVWLAKTAGFDLDNNLVGLTKTECMTDFDVRTTKETFVIADERSIQPDFCVIAGAVKAKKNVIVFCRSWNVEVTAVIPNFVGNPSILLGVEMCVRVWQDPGFVERPLR